MPPPGHEVRELNGKSYFVPIGTPEPQLAAWAQGLSPEQSVQQDLYRKALRDRQTAIKESGALEVVPDDHDETGESWLYPAPAGEPTGEPREQTKPGTSPSVPQPSTEPVSEPRDTSLDNVATFAAGGGAYYYTKDQDTGETKIVEPSREMLIESVPFAGSAYIAYQISQGNRDYGDLAWSLSFDAATVGPLAAARALRAAKFAGKVGGPAEVAAGVKAAEPSLDPIVNGIKSSFPDFAEDIIKKGFTTSTHHAQEVLNNKTLKAQLEDVLQNAGNPISKQEAVRDLTEKIAKSDAAVNATKSAADDAALAFKQEASRHVGGDLDGLAISGDTTPRVGGLLEVNAQLGSKRAEGLVEQLSNLRAHKGVVEALSKEASDLSHDLGILDMNPHAPNTLLKSEQLKTALDRARRTNPNINAVQIAETEADALKRTTLKNVLGDQTSRAQWEPPTGVSGGGGGGCKGPEPDFWQDEP